LAKIANKTKANILKNIRNDIQFIFQTFKPNAARMAQNIGKMFSCKLDVDLNLASINPLPHGVLASFYLTAGGLPRPPEEDDISREKTILMT
jgi:hypothetical protein